jgi:tetratricopeptide (TPR) repeat protein
MRKSLFFLIGIGTIVIVLSISQSCKQCNRPAEVVKNDTVGIPKLQAVNEEISKDSLNPFLYYKRAQIYEANKDFKSAATDMYIALTLDSLRPEFYTYAAELFKKTGDLKRGVQFMRKAISTDSTNVIFYVKAAELVYLDTTIAGNYRIALDYLNKAIEIDPQNAEIYYYKGSIFKEVGDTARALSAFQTATELNPKFYNAWVQIGRLLKSKKDKNAEKYFDNAIKVSDRPTDALYDKANMLKEEAIRLFDANQDAKSREKFNAAIENYKKVIELDYKDAEAHMAIGFCYYQMDSLEEAYKYYEMATKVDPTYAGAYFSKGLVAEEMGRKKEAIALYQNCLNIDPKFTRAEEHLKKLQSVQ